MSDLQVGAVYYDSETNRFTQVREILPDRVRVSGFHTYYNDAANNHGATIPISIEKASRLHDVPTVDKSEFAVYDPEVSGYRVKDENEPKRGSAETNHPQN